MNRFRLFCAVTTCMLGVLVGSASLRATTVIAPTFATLVDSAREIFVGRVVSKESHWVDSPEGRAIVTVVTFAVQERMKGSLGATTSLEFLGGTVGDVTLRVAEMPQFEVGDRAVLFVDDRGAISPLVAFKHGRLRIERDASGQDVVRTNGGERMSQMPQAPPPPGGGQMNTDWTLPDVRAAIQDRLRAR